MGDPSDRIQLVCFDIGKVNHVGLHWNSQAKKQVKLDIRCEEGIVRRLF